MFADFGVDPDGRVYATRDSEALLEMVQQGSIDPAAASVLRTYFDANRGALWDDALAHHGLLYGSASASRSSATDQRR